MGNYVRLRARGTSADAAWRPSATTAVLVMALAGGLLGLAVWSFDAGANGGTVAGVFGAFLLICGLKVAGDIMRRCRVVSLPGPPPDNGMAGEAGAGQDQAR